MRPFSDLSELEKQEYYDLAAEMLGGLYYCTRSWSAWNVGTMSQHDFYDAGDDGDLVADRAERLYNFKHNIFL